MEEKCGADQYLPRQRCIHSLPGENILWNDGGTHLSPPGSIPPDADRRPGHRRLHIARPPGVPVQGEAYTFANNFDEQI